MLTLNISLNGKPYKTLTCDGSKPMVFGRGATCDVVLSEPTGGASSEHARIDYSGGTFSITDRGSTNGTALNGTRVRPNTATPIADNDRIHLGKWLLEVKLDAPQVTALPNMPSSKGATDQRSQSLHTALRAATKRGPEAIQKALTDALNHLDPDGQRSVLNGLLSLTDGDAQLGGAVKAEISRREAIRDACEQAINALAKRHGGFDGFTSAEEVTRFFRLADQSLELMFEWIVNTLSARKTFEEKFSAKVTRFFGLDSNPIKHALTPNQAGRYLLNPSEARDPGQIKQNLAEAFRHLSVHQLSLVAGIQSALKAAVEQLDPDKIEARASHWLGGSFKRGKAWDLFKETYQGLLDNDSKLFNEVIYPNLRHGYLAAHETQGIGEGGADEVEAPAGLDVLDPLAVPSGPPPAPNKSTGGAIPYTGSTASSGADPFASPGAAPPPAPAGGIPYTGSTGSPPPTVDPFASPGAPPPAPAMPQRVDPFASPAAPPPMAPMAQAPSSAPSSADPFANPAPLPPPSSDPFAHPGSYTPAPRVDPFGGGGSSGGGSSAPASGGGDPFSAPSGPRGGDPFAAPTAFPGAPAQPLDPPPQDDPPSAPPSSPYGGGSGPAPSPF
ncbi:MAG: type VI secretion system-associated FHA domain protein [Planctomycetota bacterium]